MTKPLPLIAALPVLWLAACAHGTTGSKPGASTAAAPTAGAESTEQTKAVRIKTGAVGDNDEGKILAKYGSYYNGAKSAGDHKMAAGFGKEDANFANKSFNTKPFQKKSFWGDKEYAKKVYGGDTDGSRFMKDSKFGDKSAREGGMAAKDADRQFGIHDNNLFAGKSARETSKANIANKSDSQVDHRRQVGNAFSDPDIIDWKAQRDINVQQTKSLLGR